MNILILYEPPTSEQLAELLEPLDSFIKLAVDIRRGLLAAGGAMHADCEEVLLADGSRQEDIWGADWVPDAGVVRCESLINIRPRQNNLGLEIQDLERRARVEQVVRQVFEGH